MNIATELKKYQQSIKRTGLNNGYVVSTVWLTDLTKDFDSLINALSDASGFKNDRSDFFKQAGHYETMVFLADPDNDYNVTNWTEKDARRYNSEEDAIEGHNKMVEKWLNISS